MNAISIKHNTETYDVTNETTHYMFRCYSGTNRYAEDNILWEFKLPADIVEALKKQWHGRHTRDNIEYLSREDGLWITHRAPRIWTMCLHVVPRSVWKKLQTDLFKEEDAFNLVKGRKYVLSTKSPHKYLVIFDRFEDGTYYFTSMIRMKDESFGTKVTASKCNIRATGVAKFTEV